MKLVGVSPIGVYRKHIKYEYQDIASQGKRGIKCEKRNVEREIERVVNNPYSLLFPENDAAAQKLHWCLLKNTLLRKYLGAAVV